MTSGPLVAYRTRLEAGTIKPDPVQELAAEKLQSLHHALDGYRPATGMRGWKSRFGLVRRREEPPQGLYLCGDVGRGKSMLMDLFFQHADVGARCRVHFHDFMREIHGALHAWRRKKGNDNDPIPTIARGIVEKAWLLCLDELEIHDIADAMIVGRVFECLLAEGVVLVTTSNRNPDDLYKNGLQRDKFLPFISLIKQRLDVLELSGERDFRMGRMQGCKVYHSPINPESDAKLDECFARFADGPARPEDLVVYGRLVRVPHAAGRVARFTFAELCEKPLGVSDYLQIATHYDVIVMSGIPRMDPLKLNSARRFVTFIDALYEHKVLLVCSADVPPENLYTMGDGSFEFQRTVSRLMEMQSDDYIARFHVT